MAKTGSSFEFNGTSSDIYGVVLCALDPIDEYEMGLARSPITGGLNRFRTRVNSLGASYDDVLQFDFTIMKNPCNLHSQNDALFTRREVRELNAWLTSPELPKLLKFEDDENDEVYYFATITEVESGAIGSKLYELTYTVTCDSPFAWSPLYLYQYDPDDPDADENGIIKLKNDSDCYEDYIYPIIHIYPNETGNLTIKNITDDNQSLTIAMRRDISITIDCQLQTFIDDTGVIDLDDLLVANQVEEEPQDIEQDPVESPWGNPSSGSQETSSSGSIDPYDEFDIYIPRLLYGVNKIQIEGDAIVTFQYRTARKVGAV